MALKIFLRMSIAYPVLLQFIGVKIESMFKFKIFLFSAADQARIMEEQMSGAAMTMPQDSKAAFKSEWEALEICDHKWALKDIETEVLKCADNH